jgi:hypothetical protein
LQKLISIYQNEGDKSYFLLSVILTVEDYFEEFAANQTIKFIFNGLLPFIPCDEESHRIFEAVLIKFRNKHDHNMVSLGMDLKEIFAQRTHKYGNTVEES